MGLLNKIYNGRVVLMTTVGLSFSGVYADSLLAPLVIADSNYETYFSFKVPAGRNTVGRLNSNTIHYTWIKKGTSLGALKKLNAPCSIVNNKGRVSANDMVFQNSRGIVATPAGLHNDQSQPNGYNASNYVGMVVISDLANTLPAESLITNEGGMSGFAYIVNITTGNIQDYKLLNNHRSLADGDFGKGFTSKKSVDLSWMGGGVSVAGYTGVSAKTDWFAVVTGFDMAQDGGLFSSLYDASVTFSQNTRTVNGVIDATQDSPQLANLGYGTKGVMNNDEGFTSGNISIKVNCMGSFDRAEIMDAQLLADTRFGGWVRLSISPQDGATGVSVHRATGALVYRADTFTTPYSQTPVVTIQPETSGHLLSGKNHPNRPF